MFKNIVYKTTVIECYNPPTNIYKEIYDLTDTDFKCKLGIIIKKSVVQARHRIILEIVKEYEKRNLNVAANLALFYKFQIEMGYPSCFDEIKELHYKCFPEV